MEVLQCHDCKIDVIFFNGLPGEAKIGVCAGCGEKRRRAEVLSPDFEGFSRSPWRLLIDGQPAAISTTKVW